ncbi:protein LphB [Legionella maioricensis]|uniref:Protein LphB n=1 Tax=Legionella maioricensis TaxID=2896528 RepID=A0A9X2CXC3_9GAMM|nr:protein LphB [Legionella maioricensis]MCL9682481.1 protein LphB [Legionella maioricensis]MCL9686272.1 protein LphB [Legionella maioricensis]
MRKGVHWYDSIFILLFIYLFVLQIQAIWPFTIDDMFISLRYARHWVAGEGLLWNLHSPPVEGYSNFSFVVLGALALILNSDPVLVLKSAGVVGLFFTCFFIFFISRFWFERRESLLPCIGILLYKGQIIWTVAGLETTVYQALLCGAVYFALRGLGYHSFPGSRGSSQPTSCFFSGVFLSLAGMTRPETPAFMAVFFILMLWDRPQIEKKMFWRGMVLFVLPLLFLYLPYFLWRWHYYGFLFPNSVYCKSLVNSATVLDKNYLKLIWPFAIFACFACVRKPDKRYCFLVFPSLLYLLTLLGSDPVAAFDNRLFLPAFVLLLPLALLGISEAVLMYLKQRDQTFIRALYIVSFCMAFFFIPTATLEEYRYFTNNPVQGEQLRKKVVHWLNSHTQEQDTVVLVDAGYIPYHSKLNFVDSYCLNNLAMTQYPKAQMYDQFCHQILKEKPQVIILTSLIEQGQVIYIPSDICLKALLNRQGDYKLVKTFFTGSADSKYQYELFTNF